MPTAARGSARYISGAADLGRIGVLPHIGLVDSEVAPAAGVLGSPLLVSREPDPYHPIGGVRPGIETESGEGRFVREIR